MLERREFMIAHWSGLSGTNANRRCGKVSYPGPGRPQPDQIGRDPLQRLRSARHGSGWCMACPSAPGADLAGEDRSVATLMAGDSFGGIALSNDTPRTASVGCIAPVDHRSFAQSNIESLVGSYDMQRIKVSDDVATRTVRGVDASLVGNATWT